MKTVHKLAVATLMLSGLAQVQLAMAADPIPSVDVRPGAGRAATSVLGEVATTRGTAKEGVQPVGPAGAAINTTRSNIKKPGKAESAEANSALGTVSTTR